MGGFGSRIVFVEVIYHYLRENLVDSCNFVEVMIIWVDSGASRSSYMETISGITAFTTRKRIITA